MAKRIAPFRTNMVRVGSPTDWNRFAHTECDVNDRTFIEECYLSTSSRHVACASREEPKS